LEPDLPFGAPIFLRPEVNGQSWEEASKYQHQIIMEAIAHSRDVGQPRFAVFSLAPIPLVIYLGFLLSDRVQVRCFQFDRDQASWSWSNIPISEIDSNIQVTVLPNEVINHEVEVVIRVSLSASISLSETEEVIPDAAAEIDIFVEQPNVMWLSNPQQLSKLGQVFRQTLANIRRLFPQCRQIHLFYAGPTGGGVILGQQINPRMNPPVKLYQYSRQTTPRYQLALTLLESGA
jgi:SMODS-associated and fused to various effectors sensor domain